jgi:hydroxymethylpyrimidine/phosphomethylpyrimidine kinase
MLPIALTIAGSDSGGGAGIQADLKTFHAFGVFGTSAVTAITAQNTVGVFGVHAVPPAVVRQQIEVVAADLRPAAVKTGMLATVELVEAVAAALADAGLRQLVVDPVMVATSGDRLLEADAEGALASLLLPICDLVTPNLHEAEILTGLRASDADGMCRQAERLVARGARGALVKGGHLDAAEVVDVFFDGEEMRVWRRARLATRSTHGTGCTLSAGVAAGLAHGSPAVAAVEDALEYVRRALVDAPGLGTGHGPLNHLVAAPRRELTG